MVNTVLGDRSFGKPDVEVTLDDGETLKISLKKPSTPSGQAHLQTLARFLEAWPLVQRSSLPAEVKKVLTLFAGAPTKCSLATWAGVDDSEFCDVELRHLKLYPRTIAKLFAAEWRVFAAWLEAEATPLLDYCMFTGSAADPNDHATHLYLGQQGRLLARAELGESLRTGAHPIAADMTIHLPWGFLQTHNPRGSNKERGYPNQLQFHWEGSKLVTLAGE